jgi:hypothetical protein
MGGGLSAAWSHLQTAAHPCDAPLMPRAVALPPVLLSMRR